MKQFTRRAAGALLAAGMLFGSAAPVFPQLMTGVDVYAGDNDFSWSTYSKKDASWWSSSEAIGIADEIVQYQLSDGGWRKDMKTETTGSWNKSTIDNNATWGQIRFLAKIYSATGTEKYKTSCLKGIDLLLNGQYSNGGWPQVFNDPGTYHAHITFNDTAMVAVLRVLQDVYNGAEGFDFVDSTRRQSAKNAVDKGVECILNCQINVNGTLTAWGQQHDENTLAPAGARAYELPS
ncbi:MAG: pectate lyase, partial [Ruminococcus sp.]|nr:pectate lyase [Ruminococcus sp.]